uniref:CTCK domain-containing protein n=1 Tax=Clytia hemisphaerica TaxID=252671 RepID=A0A7M5XKS5_9CNID
MHGAKMLLIVMSLVNAVIGSITIQSDHEDLQIIIEHSNGQQQTLVKTKQQNKNIYTVNQTTTLDARVKSFRQYLMSKLSRRTRRKLSGNTVESCITHTITQKIIMNSCEREVVIQGCSGSCLASEYYYYHCRPTKQQQVEVIFDCDPSNSRKINIGSATHCACVKEQKTIISGFKR